MATTSTRKPRKKKASKKVSKKQSKVEVKTQPKNKDVLTPDDFRMVEVLSRDVQNAKLLMGLEEQSLRNTMLELKLMEHKINKQKEHLNSVASSYENKKKSYSTFMIAVHERYGIDPKAGLAFNPETGELVRE